MLGALLIGFFGTGDVAPGYSVDGIFYGGGASLLGKQALAVVSVVAYSFVATFIIAFAIDKIYKMRLSPDEEQEGMDFVLHGETAYEFTSLGGGSASLLSTATTTEEAQA